MKNLARTELNTQIPPVVYSFISVRVIRWLPWEPIIHICCKLYIMQMILILNTSLIYWCQTNIPNLGMRMDPFKDVILYLQGQKLHRVISSGIVICINNNLLVWLWIDTNK